jgi:hypothetical protein
VVGLPDLDAMAAAIVAAEATVVSGEQQRHQDLERASKEPP